MPPSKVFHAAQAEIQFCHTQSFNEAATGDVAEIGLPPKDLVGQHDRTSVSIAVT